MADLRWGHRQPGPRAANTGERGETLIEIIATSALMATAVLAIVTLLFTMVKVSHMTRRSTTANTIAHNVAESVIANETTNPYVNCAGLTTYTFSAGVPNYTAKITKVEKLSSATAYNPTWVAMPASCSDDGGLQRLTIEVTSSSGPKEQATMQVIKRNSKCLVNTTFAC